MRIVGGKYRAKKIVPPKSFRGRPTTDFAKEGLFNVLNNMVEYDQIRVLDLFSGTGAISFEFISRGVKDLTAIEKSIVHCNFINKTFSDLKAEKAYCYKKNAFNFVINTDESYDLIFADPPFESSELPTLPDLIFEGDILREKGTFILEHSKENNFKSHPNFTKEKKYGHVLFSFFER